MMAQGKLLPCVGPIDWGKDVANGVFDRACKEGTFFSRLPDIWTGGCFLRRRGKQAAELYLEPVGRAEHPGPELYKGPPRVRSQHFHPPSFVVPRGSHDRSLCSGRGTD